MKTYKENMENHADSLLLLTRDDWNLNNRSEMLYHIKHGLVSKYIQRMEASK